MGKLIVNSYDEFASHLGEVIGTSEWLEVSQERINLFADATLDHQWIHVDSERAKVESPYKTTIAHGYLTLSLLPHLWQELIQVNNVKTFRGSVSVSRLHCTTLPTSVVSARRRLSSNWKSRTRKSRHWKDWLRSCIISNRDI